MLHTPFGNDPVKIERYNAFWKREDVRRPMVGFSIKSWFPLEEFEASRQWPSGGILTPDMVDPQAFMDDQVRLLREGETMDDDIIRGACPSQAVPWLCGMLGSTLRILPGNILAEEQHLPWEDVAKIDLDAEHPWFQKYMEFAETLAKTADGAFPVTHGMLVGPTDLVAMYRGHTKNLTDLLDEPEKTQEALWQFSEIFKDITEELWKRVPRYEGGYFDAQYQLWGQNPIIRMQEDAIASYSPKTYRKLVIENYIRKLSTINLSINSWQNTLLAVSCICIRHPCLFLMPSWNSKDCNASKSITKSVQAALTSKAWFPIFENSRKLTVL